MIYMTGEEKEKIELIDKLFSALSKDDLKTFTEREEIVARLKGQQSHRGITQILMSEHDIAQAEIQMLKSEIFSLKQDLTTIVKTMVKPYDTYILSEFNSLKGKLNIY